MKDHTRPFLAVVAVLALMSAGMVLTIPADNSSATITTGSAGPNATWSYDGVTKVMTISGTGEMDDFLYTTNLGSDKSVKELVINQGITSVGGSAFYGSSLTSVSIPSSVTTIGVDAFRSNFELTSITLSEGLIEIGNAAFYGCKTLTSITIPSTVESIGFNAFNDCRALTSIIIPEGVTSIGNRAFYGCYSLESVSIPNTISSIEYSTFYGCTALTSVIIPNSVISIEKYAFYDTGLTQVTIPGSVTNFGSDIFKECNDLASVTISEGVPYIGLRMFQSCTTLMSVTLPQSITELKSSAFSVCTSLTSIILPDELSIIDSNAFSACTSLTSIAIPERVSSIGNSAFSSCNNLETAYIPNYDSITFGTNVFPETTNVIISNPPVEITSTQDDVSIITGTNFSYNIATAPADATISVTGATWLNVSDHLIYGTPTVTGDYEITVSAYKDGYETGTQTFTVTVVSNLVFTSTPTAGYILQAGE